MKTLYECMDCGRRGKLNEEITYRGHEHVCRTCRAIWDWETDERFEFFSTAFTQYASDGMDLEDARERARVELAKEDEKIAKLKKNRWLT
jgi:hypothetical protein